MASRAVPAPRWMTEPAQTLPPVGAPPALGEGYPWPSWPTCGAKRARCGVNMASTLTAILMLKWGELATVINLPLRAALANVSVAARRGMERVSEVVPVCWRVLRSVPRRMLPAAT
jgi:hypothetical protein